MLSRGTWSLWNELLALGNAWKVFKKRCVVLFQSSKAKVTRRRWSVLFLSGGFRCRYQAADKDALFKWVISHMTQNSHKISKYKNTLNISCINCSFNLRVFTSNWFSLKQVGQLGRFWPYYRADLFASRQRTDVHRLSSGCPKSQSVYSWNGKRVTTWLSVANRLTPSRWYVKPFMEFLLVKTYVQ